MRVAGLLHRDSVGDRVAERLAARQRRAALRLDADDTHRRPQLGKCECDAGRQTAAADRHDERLDLSELLVQLERDGALAGDDRGIVERMHDDGGRRSRAFGCRRQRLVDRVSAQNHVGAVALGRLHFGERCILGHEHRRCDTRLSGRPCDRLSMVTRACGDHAALALLGRERPDPVDSSAYLE